MIREDWKTAQNVFFDAEKDVEFTFNIKAENVQFAKLPVEYEANISSFQEQVEASPPTSFDDMAPFPKMIEQLDYEVM